MQIFLTTLFIIITTIALLFFIALLFLNSGKDIQLSLENLKTGPAAQATITYKLSTNEIQN